MSIDRRSSRLPTILCVDDEAIILDSLKEQLRRLLKNEYNVEVAETGEEAKGPDSRTAEVEMLWSWRFCLCPLQRGFQKGRDHEKGPVSHV